MIEIDGITKKYLVRGKDEQDGVASGKKRRKKEQITAIDNVSFKVKKGEILGILGPNGAGKTTLIKLIAGLLFPDEGKATVNGFDVVKDRNKVRTSINLLRSGGWVIFDYKLDVAMNLKFWGVIGGVPRSKVAEKSKEVLKEVGLLDKLNDYPENLSSGMRQKLALAVTLMFERPIYLMDEPTANIDPYSSSHLRDFIKNKLAGSGKTVILATHNLWEAEELCDRIAILDKGKIIALDDTEKIKRLGGRECISFELDGDMSGMREEMAGIKAINSIVADNKEKKVSIYGRLGNDALAILDIARKCGNVTNLEIKEASLNDVFINIMKEREKESKGDNSGKVRDGTPEEGSGAEEVPA